MNIDHARGLAVTVGSPCSGCALSIHSPLIPYLIDTLDRAPIFRFAAVPHPGCEGGGTYWRLVPIVTVYAPTPTPRRRRWHRKASA